jgi:hypothetical protein
MSHFFIHIHVVASFGLFLEFIHGTCKKGLQAKDGNAEKCGYSNKIKKNNMILKFVI